MFLTRVDWTISTRSEDDGSPLVRLLSLGTSFGLVHTCHRLLSQPKNSKSEASRIDRILRCVHMLLKWNPELICRSSKATGCTPLHIALRNYGNCPQLIRELMDYDTNALVLKHRNRYGDLPIHVCCAVGVPLDVLRLVLARTLSVATGSVEIGPHSLVWSMNNAGYTPIDLEWIRHIEAGNGFSSHRTFYPLDARGIRKPVGRHGELYDSLLQQAVAQAMNDLVSSRERAELATKSSQAFGLLLHRIFLIIRASFRDSFSRSPVDLSGDMVHLASALSGPLGPNLPKSILDLIRWQYPEALQRRDHLGRVPLHCCFCFQMAPASQVSSRRSLEVENERKTAAEWRQMVSDTLQTDPSACRISDNRGRLPLHYALESATLYDKTMNIHAQKAIAAAVDELLKVFPESIAACDPVSGVHPFALAAMNPHFSLDSVYRLIKLSPGVLSQATLGAD